MAITTATPTPSKIPTAPTAPAPRPAAAAPIRPANTSRLGLVKKERLRLALRYMFYGPEGVGKTTLAADAESLFLDIEGGSGEVVAARYPFNPGAADEFRPRDYDQVLAAVDDLIAHPGHGFSSVAIDTTSALEALIHKHLCVQYKVNALEKVGGGFGKGYRAAVEELRRFLSRLDLLRSAGVQVIMLGHSAVSPFKNPEGEDFDTYSLHAHKEFAGQLIQWSDVVGFIHFEGGSKKLEDDGSRDKRARGWTTNRRLIQLARSAAWSAKNRLSMPDEIELDAAHPWAPFTAAATGARDADTRSLIDVVRAELDRIGADEFTTAAGKPTTRQAVIEMSEKSDASTLSRIVAGLQATSAPTKEI